MPGVVIAGETNASAVLLLRPGFRLRRLLYGDFPCLPDLFQNSERRGHRHGAVLLQHMEAESFHRQIFGDFPEGQVIGVFFGLNYGLFLVFLRG